MTSFYWPCGGTIDDDFLLDFIVIGYVKCTLGVVVFMFFHMSSSSRGSSELTSHFRILFHRT